MAVFRAENLSIGYKQGRHRKKWVHRDLSFALGENELTCLLGPNGAGKSTLIRTLSGSQPLLGGEIYLYGKKISAYNSKELARLIGLVLTDKNMTGGLTVFEMVALGRQPHTGFFGKLNRKDKDIIVHAMNLVGVSEKASHYVAELSDGERQKVMIAKALAQECPILILDEPTAFLDVVSRIELMNLLHDLATRQCKTILMSTHDLEQALLLGDKLWLLSKENKLKCGTTEDLVFSGALDTFFSKKNISFDKMSGSFRPRSEQDRKVYLDASGELFFWTKNLLIRNGYNITADNKESDIIISVESPQKIILKNRQGEEILDSFAELNEILKRGTE